MILRNKNVLVTGATGGLGAEICKRFSQKGSRVFALGRDSPKLKALAKKAELKASFSCDFRSDSELQAVVQDIKKSAEGSIDILINCAGIFFVKSLQETSREDYTSCWNVNVGTPYFLCKEFAPHMQAQKWGRIVNIASSSAYAAAANTSAYSTAKHALLGLSRALYNELKSDGVIVSCISPGSIQTPMGKEVEKLGQQYDTFIDPKEIADYLVYNTSLNQEMVCEEVRLNRVTIQ